MILEAHRLVGNGHTNTASYRKYHNSMQKFSALVPSEAISGSWLARKRLEEKTIEKLTRRRKGKSGWTLSADCAAGESQTRCDRSAIEACSQDVSLSRQAAHYHA